MHKEKKQKIFFKVLCVAAFLLAFTGKQAEAIEFPIDDELNLLINPGLRAYGLKVEIGVENTSIRDADIVPRYWLVLNGLFRNSNWYRETDGTVFTPKEGIDGSSGTKYWRIIGDARIGTELELFSALTPFVFVETSADYNLNSDDRTLWVNKAETFGTAGFWSNNLLLGVFSDLREPMDIIDSKTGPFIEASLEWTPGWMNIYDKIDFYRLNSTSRLYFPIIFDETARTNELTMLFAQQTIFDYIAGDKIPARERTYIGGLSPQEGLGGVVRGVDTAYFDGDFRGAMNNEVRFYIGDLDSLLPGVLAFYDLGYYQNVPGLENINENNFGFVHSMGVAFFAHLKKLGTLSAGTYYRLDSPNLNGSKLTPLAIGLGQHF